MHRKTYIDPYEQNNFTKTVYMDQDVLNKLQRTRCIT